MFKKILQETGFIEKDNKVQVNSEENINGSNEPILPNDELKIEPSFSAPTKPNPKVLKNLIKEIDVHDGYSFMEFFESKHNSPNLKDALKDVAEMANLSKSVLLGQGKECLDRLIAFTSNTVSTYEEKREKDIQRKENKRKELMENISQYEKQINIWKSELDNISLTGGNRKEDEMIAQIKVSSANLKNEITNFLNKIKSA